MGMTKEYFIGNDALPKMGRVKTGNTPKASPKPSALPKLDLNDVNSDYYYEYDSLSGSEYSGTEYDLHSQPTTARTTSTIDTKSEDSETATDTEGEEIHYRGHRKFRYDDRRNLSKYCEIGPRLSESEHDSFIEITIAAIFCIFAILVFSDHF